MAVCGEVAACGGDIMFNGADFGPVVVFSFIIVASLFATIGAIVSSLVWWLL